MRRHAVSLWLAALLTGGAVDPHGCSLNVMILGAEGVVAPVGFLP